MTDLKEQAAQAITKIRLRHGSEAAQEAVQQAAEAGKEAAREVQARTLIALADALDEDLEYDDA